MITYVAETVMSVGIQLGCCSTWMVSNGAGTTVGYVRNPTGDQCLVTLRVRVTSYRGPLSSHSYFLDASLLMCVWRAFVLYVPGRTRAMCRCHRASRSR